MTRENKIDLVTLTDDFLRELLVEVKTSDVELRSKIDFFSVMVKWVGAKNKVAPEGQEGSKINEFASALNNRNCGRNRGSVSSASYSRKTPKENKKSFNDGRGKTETSSRNKDTGDDDGEVSTSSNRSGYGSFSGDSLNPCPAFGSFPGSSGDVFIEPDCGSSSEPRKNGS